MHSQKGIACLALLFRQGTRPDGDRIRHAVRQSGRGLVSHDPRDSLAHADVEEGWLELLVDGLTFDVLGLAPREALQWSTPRHHFGIKAEQLAQCEAIVIAPGPHLSGATNSIPVVRAMLGMAASLIDNIDGAEGAIWYPAASAMGGELFGQMIGQWLSGGVFPALGLTGVVATESGGLASDGLAFFTGQEIELDAALAADRTEATRLAVRLIDHCINRGRIECDEQLLGPEDTALHLAVVARGELIHITKIEGDVPGGAVGGIEKYGGSSALPGSKSARRTGA